MKAKSLKSGQILRAHMPYFRRPGHKLRQPNKIMNYTSLILMPYQTITKYSNILNLLLNRAKFLPL